MNAVTVARPVATSSWRNAVAHFFLAPATAKPLAALRIGLAAVLVCQALTLARTVPELFAPTQGMVRWDVNERLLAPGVPRIRWFVDIMAGLGIGEVLSVRLLFITYVAGLSALMVGWHTRIAAVVSWATHLTLLMSCKSSLYGVDDFAQIALFYLIWFPAGHAWSLDVMQGRVKEEPTWDSRLALRVLQIHLCVIYFSSGILKATAPPYQWWDGEVIWRSSLMPEYYTFFDLTWMADVPIVPKLIAWGTLAIEIGYPIFCWIPKTRKLGALATIGLHVGIAVMMGLVSFAAVMIVLTGSAWLVSGEVEK